MHGEDTAGSAMSGYMATVLLRYYLKPSLKNATLIACRILHGKKLNIKEEAIPSLSENSSIEELTQAALINMENVFRSQINAFLASPKPDEYTSDLLDLIESITYNNLLTFHFHAGISISVERQSVSYSAVNKKTTPIPADHITRFRVTGAPRKRLVQKLSSLTGHKITYLGFPSFAFMIGKLVITNDGTVEGFLSQHVLKGLEKAGFKPF